MTATAQQLRKGKKTKAARREHGNKAAYGFLAPYVILFTAYGGSDWSFIYKL